VRDLNSSEPCPSYGCVGSSLGSCSVREDTLRFQYENHDRLTVLVRSGCGRIFASAENPAGPALLAKEDVFTDLANWPGTQWSPPKSKRSPPGPRVSKASQGKMEAIKLGLDVARDYASSRRVLKYGMESG